jgi:ribonuclease D
LANS